MCQSLVTAVLGEIGGYDDGAGRLVKAVVVIGARRQIVPEYMEDAYRILTRNTPAEGSVLEVRSAPLSGSCRECEWQGETTSSGLPVCPACGSPRVAWDGGMELCLESLEIDD